MILSVEAIVILLIALGMILITFFHHAQVRDGRLPVRRALVALDRLRAAIARSAETGRAIHLSPGAGTIGTSGGRLTSTETVAGMLAVEQAATEAALKGAPVLITNGDAVAQLALRGTMRQAYRRAGQSQDYDPAKIQLLAHQNEFAYATGLAMVYAREPLEASLTVGAFGQEYLLAGEEADRRALPQVAGSSSNSAIPLMIVSGADTLIGEEIYAAEAYLARDPVPQARLMTHDAVRLALILLIILGLIYSFVAPLLNLPVLPIAAT